MKRKWYLFLNGIEAQAEGNISEWQFRAVRWVNVRTSDGAYAYAHRVLAIGRDIEQSTHVRNVAELIREHRNDAPHDEIVVAAHSNGAQIACDVLKDNPFTDVDELHLIAAAVSGEYEKNGLNEAVERGQVKRIQWYTSSGDKVLKSNSWTGPLMKVLTLGLAPTYGMGGYYGPSNRTDKAKDCTVEIRDDSMGHSTWFQGEQFNLTMQRVTRGVETLPVFELPALGADLARCDFKDEKGTA